MSEFEHWPKIPRMDNLTVRVTEKIDGTNAQIYIPGDSAPPIGFFVGSRNRWITPDKDNYGFARWAYDNAEMLLRLGPGRHYGEWWGAGIQRGYGQSGKKFSLFEAFRWTPERLAERELTGILDAVPILCTGPVARLTDIVDDSWTHLMNEGSVAAPGFANPEGIVVQVGELKFKVTDAKKGQKVKTEHDNPPPAPLEHPFKKYEYITPSSAPKFFQTADVAGHNGGQWGGLA